MARSKQTCTTFGRMGGKLDLAIGATWRGMRIGRKALWLVIPAGGSLLMAQPALGQQIFRDSESGAEIQQFVGVTAPGVSATDPNNKNLPYPMYSSPLVTGAEIDANTPPRGNQTMEQTSVLPLSPVSNSNVSTTASASLSDQTGLYDEIVLGTGTGVTQTIPTGTTFPDASELYISVNYRFTIEMAPTNSSTLMFNFPLQAILPTTSASADFGLSFKAYLNSPTSAPFSVTPTTNGPTIGSLVDVHTFTSTGTYTVSGHIPLNLSPILMAGDYVNLVGHIYYDANGGKSLSTLPNGALIPTGGTLGFTPIPSPDFSTSLFQPGTVGLVQDSGNTFLSTGNTNLTQAAAWQNLTAASPLGPPASLDLAQFDAGTGLTAPTTFNLNAPTMWDGICVVNPGAAVTIASGAGSNTLTIESLGISVARDTLGFSQNLTVTAPVTLGASQIWNVVNGQTLTVSGSSLNLAGNGLNLQGGGNFNLSAPISGVAGGNITMNGMGLATLTNANTYAGGTTLNNGEVMINTDSNIGGPASAITFNGGILGISGNTITNLNTHTVNWSNFTGGFDIASPTNVFTISQSIGNGAIFGGSLTKNGPGELILTGTSSYTGPTTINGGTLLLTVPGNSAFSNLNPASQVIVNSAGGLILSNGVTLANPITVNLASGEFLSVLGGSAELSGNVTATNAYNLGFPNGTATLTVTGTHTVAGSIANLTEGNLIFTGTSSLTTSSTSSTPLGLGTTAVPLNLTLKNTASITNPGSGGAVIGGSGTNSGATITIQDQASLDVGAGNLDLNNNSSSVFLSENTINLNGGNLTAGGLTFTPQSPFVVALVNFNGGVLTASANNSDFISDSTGVALKISAGGAIINTNGFNVTINCPDGFQGAPGDGGLTKEGTGQLIFGSGFGSNGNHYNGPTVVNGGLLELGGAFFANFVGQPSIQTFAGGAAGSDAGSTHDPLFLQAMTQANQHGALALSPADATQNIDYTGGVPGAFNMTEPTPGAPFGFSNMSIGAVSGGVTYTGTITPFIPAGFAAVTYLLGGGGTLTLPNGNALTGAANVLVENGGVVALTATNNYTGVTTIQGSNVITIPAADSPTGANQTQFQTTVLQVSHLANSGSSIGNSSPGTASNLVINGGTLMYVGSGDSSSRLFTIGQLGATLDSSGSGALSMTNPGTEAFAGGVTGPVTFTLAGSNNGFNGFYGELENPPGGQLSVIKNGPGYWLMANGLSTYTGGTTINAGTLLTDATSTGPVTVGAAGTLVYAFTLTVASLAGAGTVAPSIPGPGLTVSGSASTFFSGSIQGSTSLTKNGTGTLTLSGANTYNGGTILKGGELAVSSDSNIGGPTSAITFNGGVLGINSQASGTQTLVNLNTHNVNWSSFNGGFDVAAGDTFTVINMISGGGSLTELGAGTLVLAVSNSYTGGTTIGAGTLAVPNLADLGSGPVVDNGTLLISTTGTSNFAGGVSGTGGLYVQTVVQAMGGSNTYTGTSLILTGANSFTGTSTIDYGSSLTVNAVGGLAAASSVANNGSLNINASTTLNSLTGTGVTTVNTTLVAGVLVQDGLVNNGATTIASGGEIGLISGNGQLNIGTAGTISDVLLSNGGGTSTVGGLTIFSGSTLDISNNNLAVNYGAAADPVATIRGYLKSAYSGGVWTGTGLTSSTVAAQVAAAIASKSGAGIYGIGYVDGGKDINQAANAVVKAAGNQIVYTPALIGDANLDGAVTFIDLGIVAQNLGAINTDWEHGDFNYDGTTNFLDIGLLAQNLSKTILNTPLGEMVPDPSAALTAQWNLAVAEIQANSVTPPTDLPEPGMVGLLAVSAAGLMARRRRRRDGGS